MVLCLYMLLNIRQTCLVSTALLDEPDANFSALHFRSQQVTATDMQTRSGRQLSVLSSFWGDDLDHLDDLPVRLGNESTSEPRL